MTGPALCHCVSPHDAVVGLHRSEDRTFIDQIMDKLSSERVPIGTDVNEKGSCHGSW